MTCPNKTEVVINRYDRLVAFTAVTKNLNAPMGVLTLFVVLSNPQPVVALTQA